jgi:hypothetical protein
VAKNGQAKHIEFIGSFDPSRQALTIDGEGTGKITFYSSADQLAKVIGAFAEYSKTAFVVSIKKLDSNSKKTRGGVSGAKFYR